jgi:formimidoylglutamate deiminase
MPNLHSHAFQRAMAGLGERAGPRGDSFWSWRDVMYRFLAKLTPDDIEAIAAQLYVELLKHGYTAVAEFHYLHNDPTGGPYESRGELSERILAAAGATGIGMTLLPVLYITGGFDGRELSVRQRRFGHDVDGFLRLLDILRPQQNASLRVGCAFHSLRAVPETAMREVLSALPDDAPVHIHIAEQVGEVQDCLALRNARPVEWLLREFPVDRRWTLVAGSWPLLLLSRRI